MATSLLSPMSYPPTNLSSIPSVGHPKPSFLFNSKLFYSSRQRLAVPPLRCYTSPSAFEESLNDIPKQFREENLEDGVKENFKNVPERLYGLTPKQMRMFMTGNSPIQSLAETTLEENITSKLNYQAKGGMYTLSDYNEMARPKCMLDVSGRGGRRPGSRSRPRDLPSKLLAARIVFLGMPTVSAVARHIITQLMYLNYKDPKSPIYMYIKSTGSQDLNGQLVGSEAGAFSIADYMSMSRAKIHTVNLSLAFGQAAMLLSLGTKGCRYIQPHGYTKLYLPSVYESSGRVTDMSIKAEELEINSRFYLELLSKGTGKSEQELLEDIHIPKVFKAQEAIDYGLADKIVGPEGTQRLRKKRN
ncbi:ATP-dependent Clp protease proteolytic subunit-related protein 1, chloroplastic [Linum grandiflorum]